MKVSDLGTRLTQAISWRGMNGDDLARASGNLKQILGHSKSMDTALITNWRTPRRSLI